MMNIHNIVVLYCSSLTYYNHFNIYYCFVVVARFSPPYYHSFNTYYYYFSPCNRMFIYPDVVTVCIHILVGEK